MVRAFQFGDCKMDDGRKVEQVMLALGTTSVIARDYLEALDWNVFDAVGMYRADHEIEVPAIRSPGGLWL